MEYLGKCNATRSMAILQPCLNVKTYVLATFWLEFERFIARCPREIRIYGYNVSLCDNNFQVLC